MSNARRISTQVGITELKASAHLMTLDTGLFCIFQIPDARLPHADTGLPGVRITLAPHALDNSDDVVISAFHPDGWIGPHDDAALVRVRRGPAQVLVTVYQLPNGEDPPKMQVLRLSDAGGGAPVAAPTPTLLPSRLTPPQVAAQTPVQAQPSGPRPMSQQAVAPSQPTEIGAHVQMRGDIGARLGEWIGDRGSRRWMEGFAISPASVIAPTDIEYQALLGRGWLSPWSEGGHFCGSRGMALPILGLRVRLRGAAAEAFDCVYSASFVDGTAIGPVKNGEPCESATLAPLEAFQISLQPHAPASSSPAEKKARPVKTPAAPKPAAGRGRAR